MQITDSISENLTDSDLESTDYEDGFEDYNVFILLIILLLNL